MRPLIGISTYNDLAQWRDWNSPAALIPQTYVDAVRRSGGRPVLLPVGGDSAEAAATVADLDGLIVSGGGDVDPARYGARAHPETGAPNSDAGRLGAGADRRGAGGRAAVAGHLPGYPAAQRAPGRDAAPAPAPGGRERGALRAGLRVRPAPGPGRGGGVAGAGAVRGGQSGQHRPDLAGRADAPPPGRGPDRGRADGHGVGGGRDGRGARGGRPPGLHGRRAVASGGGRRPAAVRRAGGGSGWCGRRG